VSRKKRNGTKKQPVAPVGGWPTGRKEVPQVTAPRGKTIDKAAIADPDAPAPKRIVWSFRGYDVDGPYCLMRATQEQFLSIIAKLRDFEGFDLQALQAGGSQHFKRYPLDTLPSGASKRLIEIDHDDEDCICRLRLGGKQRLYGFLRENVFEILWWDPEHAVVPSHLKHT
jgi:hypothetical protein